MIGPTKTSNRFFEQKIINEPEERAKLNFLHLEPPKKKNGRIFYFSPPLIELSFTLQHDHREFAMFRVYFPLFIKLFMVLLCAIFKSQ